MPTPESVARVIQLNGGRMVGKTRFQKSVYLLEAIGIGFGFDFDYHHYGPYSEELTQLGEDAEALGFLTQSWQTSADGAEYAIFVDTGAYHGEEEYIDQKRRQVLRILKDYSAVELELAATAHFLALHGYSDDAWGETGARKSSKISPDRLVRAKKLLDNVEAIS